MAAKSAGLGNPAVLAKIDRLRDLNVGALIPLPQIVVVGDQSSGKSSVLESLTGFPFPKDVKLCTRYVTQITCSRSPEKGVSISITPRPDADEELVAKLRGFRRELKELDNTALARIFAEANKTMDLRSADPTDNVSVDAGSPAFSMDELKIEVTGPEEDHLTVIDVPGIFRDATPGVTTEADIPMVKKMVETYIENSRSIILAVMPCNVDPATQEILKLAKHVDPDGHRTMGVLTKPDLMIENATKQAVIDLIAGRSGHSKLGYAVVKNRGADDKGSSQAESAASESAFFKEHVWASVRDRCGIQNLKPKLRVILTKLTQQELPHVKADIIHRLRESKTRAEALGPARSDEASQRLFLGKIATRFQTISCAARNGTYVGNPIFDSHPSLKLATEVIQQNEDFADTFSKTGHLYSFQPKDSNEKDALFRDMTLDDDSDVSDVSDVSVGEIELEIQDLLEDVDYDCPLPVHDGLIAFIKTVYEANRGPDLGTFGATMLSAVFNKQSEKWKSLTLRHVSQVIATVHLFIRNLIQNICPDEDIQARLLDGVMMDKLCIAYSKAMAHARLILKMERECRPSTVNHYFSSNLQSTRAERLYQTLKQEEEDGHFNSGKYGRDTGAVPLDRLRNVLTNMSNRQQACEDIYDILQAYYKVARKRFVDVICQQVVNYYLLEAQDGPLNLFGSDLVAGFDAEQLQAIAGEDEESAQLRSSLEREIVSLEAAIKELRW